MAKFVVAYLSLHDEEMEMVEVTAKDEYNALVTALDLCTETFDTLDRIYEYCADTDIVVGVHEI